MGRRDQSGVNLGTVSPGPSHPKSGWGAGLPGRLLPFPGSLPWPYGLGHAGSSRQGTGSIGQKAALEGATGGHQTKPLIAGLLDGWGLGRQE